MKNNKNNILQFPIDFHSVKLTLGEDVCVYVGNCFLNNCRVIKTTRKGFNILNLNTNRTILKNHLYGKGMAGKEYPNTGTIRIKTKVPDYITIIKKQNVDSKNS